MSIKIRLLLLAACLLLRLTNCSTINDDDSDSIALSAQSVPPEADEIPPDPNVMDEEHATVDRGKRLSFSLLKDMLKPKALEPSLGSAQDSSKPKSKAASILDAFAKAMKESSGKGLTTFPLMSQRKTLPSSEKAELSEQKELSELVAATHTRSQLQGSLPPCSSVVNNNENLSNEPSVGMTRLNGDFSDALNIGPSDDNLISEPIVGAKGPVVTPTFLMDDTNVIKPSGYSPYRITAKQIQETAALRKEINNAVKNHIYVHSSSEAKKLPKPAKTEAEEEPPSPTRYYSNIFEFWDRLISQSRSRFKRPLFGAPIRLGDARSDFSFVPNATEPAPMRNDDAPAETFHDMGPLTDDDVTNAATVDQMMANAAARARDDGIVSNTVDSFVNNVEQPMYEMSQTRETLQMKSITEDMRFKIGDKVIEWKTLQRHHQEAHALIGLTKSGVLLVLEKNNTYTLESEISLFQPIYFTTLTHWNHTSAAVEGIVIVATEHEIVFLRINEQMTTMESFWMWPVYKKAQYIKYFELDGAPTLMLVADTSANFYRLDFDGRVSYLRESFQLNYPATTAAVVNSGHETFLCFPQKSMVVVYKYTDNRFKRFTQIDAENAETLSAFEMGGYSYLAIGGAKPRILRHHRGDFQDQTILAQSWGYVEHFLPIPARTYRDDLILLIQHRVTYGTHDHSYVEALIWNGRAFDAALTVPCYVNQVKSPIGMACMLDAEREEGILGATVFQRNRTISILVPRFEAPSGLFDLEIELMPAAYTYNEHLIELFSEVMILLETRDQILTNTKELLDNVTNVNFNEITITGQTIDSVYTEELELGATVPSNGILFNGETITDKKAILFAQVFHGTQAVLEQFDHDQIRPKRNADKPLDNYRFKSVNVDELYVDYVDDIPVNDFVFIEDGQLVLDGTVELSQPIEAERVEQIDETEMFVGDGPKKIDTHIGGDLTFDEINGIKWKVLIDQIVMKNIATSLADIDIHGNLLLETGLQLSHLNGLNFPAEFVREDDSEEVIITGKKTFTGILVTDVLDCSGTLNGIEPARIVTLNSTQFLSGKTTFRHLEVVQELEVSPTGTISGRHLNEFLANPTLQETLNVHSNCMFKSISVEGPVFIKNTLNDQNLDDVLGDVVYKHESKPKCASLKTFESFEAPNVLIKSKLLNDIPFDAFVTKNTKQTFSVSRLHGDVFIDNLKIDGLVDFINVTDLDMNAIKLVGEQFTNAELIFGGNETIQLKASQIVVRETINGIDVNDFIDINGNFELFGDVLLDTLQVNKCTVNGDILGDGRAVLVNGFNMSSLQDAHLSRSSSQEIAEPVSIRTAVVRNTLQANNINNFDYARAVDILQHMENIDQLLNDSTVHVDKMDVDGNIQFTNINGFDFDDIQKNAIRLDAENSIPWPIVFADSAVAEGNLTIEQLNGVHFDDFVNDLVKRDDEQIVIGGSTVFRGPVRILADINTANVNGFRVNQILTKNYKDTILNRIEIDGDVFVTQLMIDGRFNNVTKEQIEVYDFDEQNHMHVLRKNVEFAAPIAIQQLQLDGGYDNIRSAGDYIKSTVRIDRPNNVTGTKFFAGRLSFDNDIHISQYNGINVQEFLSNVILIDQAAPIVFERNVRFTGPITAPVLRIAGDLVVNTMNNCSLDDWLKTAIRMDMPFFHNGSIVFDDGAFEAVAINTETLNGLPANKILTLNTAQRFEESIHFDAVESFVPLTTTGLVSGYDLVAEEANTFRVNGDQNVTLPTIFNKIRVLGTLTTGDTVNGRDIKLAAPLSGNILLDSPLSFDTVSAGQLRTKDFVSGINMDKWFATALQRWSPHPQNVTGHWHIKNATFDRLAIGDRINDMDILTFIRRLDNSLKRSGHIPIARKCDGVESVPDFSQSTVTLSNFESAFKVQFQETINSVYPFNQQGQNYFLFNAGCETFVYGWKDQNRTLIPLNMERTGFVSQWIHIIDSENRISFVSNNDGSQPLANCMRSGAFVWRFSAAENALKIIAQFGNIGEFRSMHVNPTNSTNFFAIRNLDNTIVEFNLNGQLVGIWRANNVTNSENSKFVVREANLGLAIADDDSVKMLHSQQNRVKRCAFLSKIDWEKHRADRQQAMEQAMGPLRAHWEASRNVLQSILRSDEQRLSLSSQLHQLHKERFHDFMQKSNERLSALLNINRKTDNEAARATGSTISSSRINFDKFTVGMNKKGKLIVDIMDKVYDWIRKNEEFHRQNDGYQSYSMDYGRQNTNEESEVDLSVREKTVNNELSNPEIDHELNGLNMDHELKSSAVEHDLNSPNVDIQPTTFNPILGAVEMEINDEAEEHPYADYFERVWLGDQLSVEPPTTQQPTETPFKLNTSSNEPELGTIIGFLMLERTLAHTVNRAADALFGQDKKRTINAFGMDDYKEAELNLFPKLFATHDEHTADERNASADRILQMISHAEYVTQNDLKQHDDELVGMDFMGTWMYKLEPFADKIADEISDEIQHRRHKHQYEYEDSYDGSYALGATQFDGVETTTEKKSSGWWGGVKSGFRKMGRAMVKVYVLGKEKYTTAKKYFNEAEEFLYGYMDDNENDDRSYGPTEHEPIAPKTTTKPKYSSIDTIKKSLPSMKDFVKSFSIRMLKTFVGARSAEAPVNFWMAIKEAAKVALRNENPNVTDAEIAEITADSQEFTENFFKNLNKTVVVDETVVDKTVVDKTAVNETIVPMGKTPETDSKDGKVERHSHESNSEGRKSKVDSKEARVAGDTKETEHFKIVEKEKGWEMVKPSSDTIEAKSKVDSHHTESHQKHAIKKVPATKEASIDKMYEKFAPLVDYLSDQIVEDLQASLLNRDDDNEADELETVEESTTTEETIAATISPELSSVTDTIDIFLGIDQMQPFTTTQAPQWDPETLVDLTNEIEVLADLLSTKLIEELRQHHNPTNIDAGSIESIAPNTGRNESLGTANVPCTENVTMSEISEQINDLDTDTLRLGSMNELPAQPDELHRFETTTLPIPNGMARTNGEIVAVKVNENRKHLFLVSSLAQNNDRIQVFEDVVDGKVLQTIPCSRPRSLVAFNIFRETVLAFVQDNVELKTFIYRGINGFDELTSFRLRVPIKQIVHFETKPVQTECPEHYVALVLDTNIQFLRAVTLGQCKMKQIPAC